MGLDTKAETAVEPEDTGDAQSKKAAKKLAKEAAKAAKVKKHFLFHNNNNFNVENYFSES